MTTSKKKLLETTSPHDNKKIYKNHQEVDFFEEGFYKTLANNFQIGIYIIQDKKFQFVNFKIQEYAGYTEEEMLAMAPASIIYPSDRHAVITKAINMLENNTRVSPYEYRIITKQGEIKWIMGVVTPIMFKGKEAVLGNSIDITEQKSVKKNLQELNDLKASILEAIPQAVVGLENRRINFANAAVEKVFGWQPEELIGKNSTIFYRNEQESEEIARFSYTTLKNQRTYVTDFPCRRKDGKDILCRMRSSLIGKKLKKRRVVITYDDITEQKQSEEELQKSREQLRNLSEHLQSVREKESTRIAREIHDELGQSLLALQMDISWLGACLQESNVSLSDKLNQMRRLVDETINFVHRISTELRPALLDDLGLTAAIEWQIQEFQERTGVQCEARLDFEGSTVERDMTTALFRIFQETLTNVARHANATLVHVRLRQTVDYLRLEVSDNGKGITSKEINDSKSFGIIGIQERASLWGGSVSITGKPHKGTKVVVLIPLHYRRG